MMRSCSACRLFLQAATVLLAACARQPEPAAVAIEYGRALYAGEPHAIYRLISAEDQRIRSEADFVQQQERHVGFTRELLAELASFIVATPTETRVNDRRATVRLEFALPNANAPEIRALAHDWDERMLNALPDGERRRIRDRLAELHRTHALPMVEGEETFTLVRDAGGWRVVMDWARSVRLHFHAAVLADLPLQVEVVPAEVAIGPGEPVRVTIRARNTGPRDVTMRVGHGIEPSARSSFLVLLQCPLVLPVTLKPGATEEFQSEYLVLKDVPESVTRFDVTYRFPADGGVAGLGAAQQNPAARASRR